MNDEKAPNWAGEMQERIARRTVAFEAHSASLLVEIAALRGHLSDRRSYFSGLRDDVLRQLAEVQRQLDALAADLRDLRDHDP